MSLRPTASQTVGPFFKIGLSWLTCEGPIGAHGRTGLVPLEICGQVTDGAGQPVPDAVIEVFAGTPPAAIEALPGEPLDAARVQGFGRVPADEQGWFRFQVAAPEARPGHAPYLVLLVFMRGLLKAVSTRIYFEGAPENERDPVLSRVPPERRRTLLARLEELGRWRFDVRMQGDDETVFFEY